ncbi:hypothetical protein [Cohnella rhizosphaerae]|uniref:Uncharacterized protein n=1 Tax=Cohnella rhizosphaerae TaxID=1457232 RepID=A0A9X4QR31_9BACL|nr:hypothetical protein [Cohnella rhizosphaerae]MDG0808616.1 hypothetical protein [Cohnella rhizosphaerae]
MNRESERIEERIERGRAFHSESGGAIRGSIGALLACRRFSGGLHIKACIFTCIFCRPTAREKIHANLQANSKRKPENGPMEGITCTFASFVPERIDIGKIRCIFAGFRRNETADDDWLLAPLF